MYSDLLYILNKHKLSISYLARATESSYCNIWKLCHNKTDGITFELLNKICIELGCTPSDILIVER